MKSVAEIKEEYAKVQAKINKILLTQKVPVNHPLRQEQANLLCEEMKNIVSYWNENGGLDGRCFKIDKYIFEDLDFFRPTYVKIMRATIDDNQRYITCEREYFEVDKMDNPLPNFGTGHSICSVLALNVHPDFLVSEGEYDDAKGRTLRTLSEAPLAEESQQTK